VIHCHLIERILCYSGHRLSLTVPVVQIAAGSTCGRQRSAAKQRNSDTIIQVQLQAMSAAPTSVWLRVAALSGASAVALGAYGAHGLKHLDPKSLDTFDRGNKYHLMHSLLLAVSPLARWAACLLLLASPTKWRHGRIFNATDDRCGRAHAVQAAQCGWRPDGGRHRAVLGLVLCCRSDRGQDQGHAGAIWVSHHAPNRITLDSPLEGYFTNGPRFVFFRAAA